MFDGIPAICINYAFLQDNMLTETNENVNMMRTIIAF